MPSDYVAGPRGHISKFKHADHLYLAEDPTSKANTDLDVFTGLARRVVFYRNLKKIRSSWTLFGWRLSSRWYDYKDAYLVIVTTTKTGLVITVRRNDYGLAVGGTKFFVHFPADSQVEQPPKNQSDIDVVARILGFT